MLWLAMSCTILLSMSPTRQASEMLCSGRENHSTEAITHCAMMSCTLPHILRTLQLTNCREKVLGNLGHVQKEPGDTSVYHRVIEGRESKSLREAVVLMKHQMNEFALLKWSWPGLRASRPPQPSCPCSWGAGQSGYWAAHHRLRWSHLLAACSKHIRYPDQQCFIMSRVGVQGKERRQQAGSGAVSLAATKVQEQVWGGYGCFISN